MSIKQTTPALTQKKEEPYLLFDGFDCAKRVDVLPKTLFSPYARKVFVFCFGSNWTTRTRTRRRLCKSTWTGCRTQFLTRRTSRLTCKPSGRKWKLKLWVQGVEFSICFVPSFVAGLSGARPKRLEAWMYHRGGINAFDCPIRNKMAAQCPLSSISRPLQETLPNFSFVATPSILIELKI